MRKILVIEDDVHTQALVGEMLRSEFEVDLAGTAREGIQRAVQLQPHLVLLDLNLPDASGFEVCQRLREHPNTRAVPIVFLSMVSEVDSKVRGLEIGADDYIAKPFVARELLARVNARLRSQEVRQQTNELLVFENIRIDPKAKQLQVDGREVHLTQIEFELLRYFVLHRNEVIPRRRLLGDLWPDSVVSDRTVDTHIANLRRKVRGARFPLSTIYGAGYILRSDSVSPSQTQPNVAHEPTGPARVTMAPPVATVAIADEEGGDDSNGGLVASSQVSGLSPRR